MSLYNPEKKERMGANVSSLARTESLSQSPDTGNYKKLRSPFKYSDPERQKELDCWVAEQNAELEKQQNQRPLEDDRVLPDSKTFWDEMTNPFDFLDDPSIQIQTLPPPTSPPYYPQPTSMSIYTQTPTISPSCGSSAFWGGMIATHSLQVPATPQVNSDYDFMSKTSSMVNFVVTHSNVYLYNGKNYEIQSADDVEGVILDLCRDDAIRIGKYSPIKNACKLITIDRRFRTPQEWIDAGKQYVTFQNGNLDLKTGNIVPHNPSIFTTFCIHANYLGQGGGIETPVFDQVLSRASGGDGHFIERVLQMFGYVLTSDVQGKCGFLLQGVTNSGKSLLCNFLSSFFPEDKVAAISLHSIGERFSTAELEGVALCITPDLPSTPLSEKAAGMVKALSGNDLIQADRKYQKHTKFHFTGKFVMSTNHALLTKNYDPAFADRIVVLPFLYSIPRVEWDNSLLEKLKIERDAVASRAIDAYFRLCRNNYIFSGNYTLNSPAVIGQPAQYQCITPEFVDQYVRRYYRPVADGRVFVSDAHADFCMRFECNPDPALFGKLFIEAANRCYGVAHERKRRITGGNPISCVVGLCQSFDG